MTEPIREALTHAAATLRTCASEQREAVLDWINNLLDQIQR